MKNEQQSQNLLLKIDPRSTFRNNFLQPATNVFVARQVDQTGNIDKNLQRDMLRNKLKVFVRRLKRLELPANKYRLPEISLVSSPHLQLVWLFKMAGPTVG